MLHHESSWCMCMSGLSRARNTIIVRLKGRSNIGNEELKPMMMSSREQAAVYSELKSGLGELCTHCSVLHVILSLAFPPEYPISLTNCPETLVSILPFFSLRVPFSSFLSFCPSFLSFTNIYRAITMHRPVEPLDEQDE